jgi:anti-sigma factor RsiW
MSACPDKLLLLHALVDDELAPGEVAALEAHLAGCAACASELEELNALKGLLDDPQVRYAAPTAWRDRALAALPREATRPRRPDRTGWLAAGSAAVLVAGVMVVVSTLSGSDLSSDLVEGHIRSLQAQHLLDVPTSDRHVVKPWFNGRIDFAPPVPDLAGEGFPLAGGRLDYLHGRAVAALVYRRRAHVINLFVWPGVADARPRFDRRQGYSLAHWGRGGLVYWAVSDIDPPDLARFQALFVAASPP